jgi:hypothetical protein
MLMNSLYRTHGDMVRCHGDLFARLKRLLFSFLFEAPELFAFDHNNVYHELAASTANGTSPQKHVYVHCVSIFFVPTCFL